MKKYLVIGNPIEHSLSPVLHNYWIRKNNITAIYEKKKLNEVDLEGLVYKIRKKELHGINVTVPFKKSIIPYLDDLSYESKSTQSVNTVYLKENKIIGHNTDIFGFENSFKNSNLDLNKKKVLILGAGGVVSSIIFALIKMKASDIIVSNRTREKAENLKDIFKKIKIIDWGEVPSFDIIINATSVGLKKNDEINLNLLNVGKNKFFYDVIYNPDETNFLKTGKKLGNRTENGKLMFIYQALSAFSTWHGIEPQIDNDVIKLLDK